MKLRVILTEILEDPYLNLAIDEALLIKNDLVLRIWRNNMSVVLGILSRVNDEINLEYITEKNIPLLRRISGGGSVYHDMGNINYTIIVSRNLNEKVYGIDFLYKKLLNGTINAIELLTNSSPVEVHNESDITFLGYKISGNAGYILSEKYMLHGTLLVSADLSVLYKALIIPPRNLKKSDKIDMVKYKVNNLSSLLNRTIFFDEVVKAFIKGFEDLLGVESYLDEITNEELEIAERLAKEKYSNKGFIFKR
ncbi:ligase [Sulfolobus sp. A20]|uniref:lipoate--protein ligase family protein n=1 Tax=Saccharolobus sp. A20 TaxID=1891280 RepID=UPI0008461BB6|nr:biotin/lipoate A/B protein ligase family protein [Sulfolobus sp. A20]TRM76829.1 lipoate--protein ligase family protein [Sulfolobus sp. E5]TRM77237.1 lipoate--protein ligase family protein [Sulfolobus sp. A20-N-F8]TRM81494.1 lipoate--protein ligase family protein [Sulfolobus sp. D5]TRM84273.1 lipoate--protein ligase family protein [Sulfolobus sp. A20-N-F6]TRM89643.1 lipoate--protein ligase family protein [Sulfolobus sp. C3]TRN02730.1 lipoate--protein ligase family protein [Sulfolobus sp. F1